MNALINKYKRDAQAINKKTKNAEANVTQMNVYELLCFGETSKTRRREAIEDEEKISLDSFWLR